MAPIFLDLVTFRASSFSSFESSIRLMARSTHWRASDATQMVYCLNCLRLRTVTENVLGDVGERGLIEPRTHRTPVHVSCPGELFFSGSIRKLR